MGTLSALQVLGGIRSILLDLRTPVRIANRPMRDTPLLFLIDDTGGLVPVVQEVPLQEHDDEEEAKSKDGRSEDESEEVVGFELGAGVLDGIAEASDANTGGAGE